jgi:predicted ATPase/DNA-binding SARP family transcriptional activator/DNA-binding CsgD family transcriptional regulator
VAQKRPTARTMESRGRVGSSGASEAIRVKLLGGFSVSVGSRTVPHSEWRLRKAAALVKLLAMAPGHRLHREQLMDLLWPESGRKAASNSLRKTLHAVRKTLDSAGGSGYLAGDGESLVLCPYGELWVDVDAFERAAATARRSRGRAAYRAALELYTGELLPEDRYEGWAEGRREELRHLRLAMLVELAELYEAHGEVVAAVEPLQKVIADEPTNEEAHARLMRLYALTGREGDGLLQYERLRDALSGQLGAEPSTATKRLREDLAAGRFPMAPAQPSDPSRDDTKDASKYNLPAPRSSFVGRVQEIVEIKRTLAMTRLLTLTGAGGSGKTRLALEVARDLVGVYPDGAWLVELASLPEEKLVAKTVAEALGVPERPQELLSDTLADVLRDREMLLLMDNCEHLVEAAARLVDALLDSCARLRVLATSREALGLEGEIRWPVPTLSVPERGREPSPEELEGYESIRLFVERAGGHDPSFSLNQQNGRAVVDICRTLEGIPLAIELAAASVGILSLERISQSLKGSIELLARGGRMAAPRQRTLRGALDWSYGLLSESEKALFRRLSVFAGGSTLEAIEVVTSGEGVRQNEVTDLLSGLVDKSLVVAEQTSNEGVRYRLLEPIRQYALGKLEESGKAQDVKRSHAEYFLALAEEAEPQLIGPREAEWFDRLGAELGNLRTALSWAQARDEAELGLRLAGALMWFWSWEGLLGEGRSWLEEALAHEGPTSALARAKALGAASSLARAQGDLRRAKLAAEEGLRLSKEAATEGSRLPFLLGGSPAAYFLNLLALVSGEEGDHERLAKLSAEGLRLSRQVNDEQGIVSSLLTVAVATVRQGDYGRAVELYEKGLSLSRELDSASLRFLYLSNWGYAALLRGDYQRGTALAEEAVELGKERRRGFMGGLPYALDTLGWAALLSSEPKRAEATFEENLTASKKLGDKGILMISLEGLACVAAAEGETLRAARLFGAAETLMETTGLRLTPQEDAMIKPYRTSARSWLGDVAWEEALAEGRAMGLERAIEYALSEAVSTSSTSQAPQRKAADAPALHLTPRQEEVAALVAEGLTNHQIAARLVISEATAETHLARIFKKLGLHSRTQLTVWVNDRSLSSSNSG